MQATKNNATILDNTFLGCVDRGPTQSSVNGARTTTRLGSSGTVSNIVVPLFRPMQPVNPFADQETENQAVGISARK
jgi:hypothetical protein